MITIIIHLLNGESYEYKQTMDIAEKLRSSMNNNGPMITIEFPHKKVQFVKNSILFVEYLEEKC